MELVHGTCKTSEFGSEDDFISSMPENVITNILDRLRIRDAVRTSILSTAWRYKWTMLTKLKFNDELFDSILEAGGTDNCNWRNVIRFLVHLKGPTTKFFLEIQRHVISNEDVNDWFLLLSRKGIKEVTLINLREQLLNLPAYLSSCVELKELKLSNFYFHAPPSFHGFPNLLSLHLSGVHFESGKCRELINWSPLLEALKFSFINSSGTLNLVELAKLVNLKILTLQLMYLENIEITSSSIFQLLGSLPKLQVLHLGLWKYKLFAEAGARKRVPISFHSLKTLDLVAIDLDSDIMLSFAFELIWSSLNLQTLTITGIYEKTEAPSAICSSEVDHDTMGQLQLRSVVFKLFRGLKNEIFLIKYLLACSPLLEKMEIRFDPSTVSNDSAKFKLAKKLLKLHRASTIAEVKPK